MKLLRLAPPFALGLALALAMGTAAEPPQLAPQVLAPAEGALDTSPAPGDTGAVAPEPARNAGELPPAARSGVWHEGARKPADAPPGVVVRAAMRNPPPAGAGGRDGGEGGVSRSVEIIWNAPGS